MAQRFKFIGITILSILLLTIVGAVSLSPAYAPLLPTMTLNVSPNPALPNQAVTFSGQVTPPATSADNIQIEVEPDNPECLLDIRVVWLAVNLAPSTSTPSTISTFTGIADSAGYYSITVPGGFPAGPYGVIAEDASLGVLSGCVSFTVAPPIPEYPLGLSVLAIFMIIAYGLVRRRTSATKN
jgi:hypothetical protein